jgi:integrase
VNARSERLTDTKVKRLPFAASGEAYTVRDTDLGGFHLRVTDDAKTFKYTTDVLEGSTRRTLGFTLGIAAELPADEARRKAENLARQRKDGTLVSTRIKTQSTNVSALTLRQGWEKYKDVLIREGKSPKTVEFYEAVLKTHLAPWADTPLKDITRAMVTALHEEISSRGHRARANQVVTTGGGIYTFALKGLETPGLAILSPWRSYRLFHKIHPRQTGLSLGMLASWWEKIDKLNPVIREANLWAILSACRKEDVISLRWDQINIKKRYVEIPLPTKSARPFRLPLSRGMLRCLFRARKASQMLNESTATTWVFASNRSATGHIADVKNIQQWKTADGVKHVKAYTEQSAHALRHSWRGAAEEARIPLTHSKILMNHAVPSDVHSEYLTLDSMFDDLRRSQEAVSSLIIQSFSPGGASRGLM